jgi:hypothetical protein
VAAESYRRFARLVLTRHLRKSNLACAVGDFGSYRPVRSPCRFLAILPDGRNSLLYLLLLLLLPLLLCYRAIKIFAFFCLPSPAGSLSAAAGRSGQVMRAAD